MRYSTRTVLSSTVDGGGATAPNLTRRMLSRTAREGDAEGVLELLLRLDEETRFMMYEPGERSTSVERQAEILRNRLAGRNRALLLREGGGLPVGPTEGAV